MYKPDIVVYSVDKTPQLVIEIKTKKGASPEWATKLRRNLIVHGVIPASPFFLLILPDHLYLWKDSSSMEVLLPDYVIDASPILTPFLKATNLSLNTISGEGLELVVDFWLNELIDSELPDDKTGFDWLYASGLYEAIKNGSVVIQGL